MLACVRCCPNVECSTVAQIELWAKGPQTQLHREEAMQINQSCKEPNRQDQQASTARYHTTNTKDTTSFHLDTMAQQKRSKVMIRRDRQQKES